MIDQTITSIGPAVLILGVLVLIAVAFAWRISRAEGMLTRWAEENGYQIMHKEHRWLRRGPYFFRASDDQAVYYVEVMDRHGRTRRGYVRLGGWFAGLFSNQVDVRWDD